MPFRHLMLVPLLLVGCGSTAPQEKPTTPLVEIAQVQKAPPLEMGEKDASADERIPPTNVYESPDICLKKMRDGRGLPAEMLTTEDGNLYTESRALERAEILDSARKSYLRLLQSFPQSPLTPHTYFAFGELFYHEAQADPTKSAFAEQSFLEALKYPGPTNTTMPYALFRLAQLHAARGRGPESLNMLKKFGALSETQPEAQCVKALGESSRKLMATTYADAAQPERAFTFFARSMGDRAPAQTNAFETLANLCDVYIQRQKPENAAAALASAGEEHASSAFCLREEKIIAAISSSIPASTRDNLLRFHMIRCQP